MAKGLVSVTAWSKEQSSSTAITSPPRSVFLRLLVDPERADDLARLLRKYPDPAQQHHLLRTLQDAQFSHQLRITRGKRVSNARAWDNKRKRWGKRMAGLDGELEALLIQFRDSIYPVLRATNSLRAGYSRDLADVFTAITYLQRAVTASQILSQSFTTRGHQKQPYLSGAVKAMRALHITKADAEDLLIMIGVKHDAVAS